MGCGMVSFCFFFPFFLSWKESVFSSFMLFRLRDERERVYVCVAVPIQSLKWEKTPFAVHTGGISDGDNSAKQKGTS